MLFLFLISAALAGDASGPIVLVESGKLEGVYQEGFSTFFGVPFGSAQQRFTLPTPVSPWSGVRPAKERANGCAQPGLLNGVEDCLFLDIYVPVNGSSNVFVFIHGGGFFLGSSSDYDGSELARKQMSLIVILNYRLGAFGFSTLNQPNLGLIDQQFALSWIQRNIGAFGGDPKKVTIAGESAGGGSVATHLISPGSKGLFSSAALLSPATSQQFACSAMQKYSDKLLSLINCTDLSCAQSVSTSVMIDAFLKIFPTRGMTEAPFAPCVDGRVIPAPVAASQLPDIPILVGKTQSEGNLFAWLDASQFPGGIMSDDANKSTSLLQLLSLQAGADADKVVKLYNPLSIGAWTALSSAYGDFLVNCLADWIGMTIPNSFRYVFNSFDPMASNFYLGPAHAMDVPFWFQNRSVPFGLGLGVNPQFPLPYAELSERMATVLLTFQLQQTWNNSEILVFSEHGDSTKTEAAQSNACKMWIEIFSA